MSDDKTTAEESNKSKGTSLKHAIIGSIVALFIISGIIGYFGSQYIYHDIIHQKIMRDKANH